MCYSPFPIHGLDDAMGMKRSILPWFVFFGGMTGTLTAFLLAYITQVRHLPDGGAGEAGEHLHHAGVLPDHVRADDPVLRFHRAVRLLALMQLPRLNHPLFASKQFQRFTDDGFFICIEARDPKFHQAETKAFLEEHRRHRTSNSWRTNCNPTWPMQYFFLSYFLDRGASSSSFAGFRGHKFEAAAARRFSRTWTTRPRSRPSSRARSSPTAMRMRQPVAGTVPMGFDDSGEARQRDGFEHARTTNSPTAPAITTPARSVTSTATASRRRSRWTTRLLKRGQERYNIYCAICHGASGNGKGVFTQVFAGHPRPRLHQPRLR